MVISQYCNSHESSWRNRARLAMQDRAADVQDGIRTRNRQTVRRKLFEDDDGNDGRHISTGLDGNFNNHLTEEHEKELEEKKKRWNFDFKKEEPLPGRWEWSKVESEGIGNSQDGNLENSQATMIRNNQETDGSDVTRETRANRPKSESDLDVSPEN